METGTAIIRACIYIMQRQENPDLPNIDVINMSYGEQSHWSTSGRVGQLMSEVSTFKLLFFKSYEITAFIYSLMVAILASLRFFNQNGTLFAATRA